MIQNKRGLLSPLTFDYILELNIYSKVLKGKYFTKKDFIEGFIKNLNKNECQVVHSSFINNEKPKELAIKLLLNKTNDKIIREKFVTNELIRKIRRVDNDIVFFEFSVDNKRTDINRINGSSISYEIKSDRDNLNRAIEQTKTFLRVFEFVYVISSNIEKNQISEFDDRVGFWRVDLLNNSFKKLRNAKRNKYMNPESQIKLLQKKELKKYPSFKSDNRKQILRKFDDKDINKAFKEILKNRYREKWISYYMNFDRAKVYSIA